MHNADGFWPGRGERKRYLALRKDPGVNVPALRQMRKAALARRAIIDASTYQPRHAQPRAKTFWEASKPSSGLASIARALTSLRLSRRPKAPQPVHPAVIESAAVVSMLRRQAGAHRVKRTTRQSAPSRLPGRRRAAQEITAELRLNLHRVRRHAEDVGTRRLFRLIPAEWSVA